MKKKVFKSQHWFFTIIPPFETGVATQLFELEFSLTDDGVLEKKMFKR